MIVGFTITDFKGHEKEAVEFIRKVCILDSPKIAGNIVNAGVGVNIYSSVVTSEMLNGQPFLTSPIETKPGMCLLASAVNFNIEISSNRGTVRLSPTEYVYVRKQETAQFLEVARQGLVKLISENGEIMGGKSYGQ